VADRGGTLVRGEGPPVAVPHPAAGPAAAPGASPAATPGAPAAAAQRAGIPYKVQPATLGTGSDAGPFSRACLKATALIGFTVRQLVAFYHQEWDSPEVLTIEPLLNVLKLTLEWIRSGGEVNL